MDNGVPDMSGELACLIAYIGFLLISWVFYKMGILVKPGWFVLLAIVYMALGWLYFEMINQLHYYLRDNKILYIEFGHASLELLILMMFCFLNAAVFVGITNYKREKRNQ
jgi:hypothetical protein